MEDADDFNQSRLERPIVEHCTGFLTFAGGAGRGHAANEKAKSGQEFLSGMGERAFRISSDYSHRCSKEDGIAAPSFGPPSFGAGRKNVCEIGLGRPCQANPLGGRPKLRGMTPNLVS